MDSIPHKIREKLLQNDYLEIDDLPNTENLERWKIIQTDCSLTNPELTRLMNIVLSNHCKGLFFEMIGLRVVQLCLMQQIKNRHLRQLLHFM